MLPLYASLLSVFVLFGVRVSDAQRFEEWALVCPTRPTVLRQRADYVYTPTIGAHKLHTEKFTWNVARKICYTEGAHLAVLNSEAEAQKLAKMLQAHNDAAPPGTNDYYGWIGFHDFFDRRDWVTIHGEPLATTGYLRWKENEPNGGEEHCGSMDKYGGLNDHLCHDNIVFFCEIPSAVLSVNCNA